MAGLLSITSTERRESITVWWDAKTRRTLEIASLRGHKHKARETSLLHFVLMGNLSENIALT